MSDDNLPVRIRNIAVPLGEPSDGFSDQACKRLEQAEQRKEIAAGRDRNKARAASTISRALPSLIQKRAPLALTGTAAGEPPARGRHRVRRGKPLVGRAFPGFGLPGRRAAPGVPSGTSTTPTDHPPLT